MRVEMAEVARIVHALAWPIVTFVLVWRFGSDIKRLIEKVGDRLDQAATVKMKLGGLGAIELAGLIARSSLVPLPDSVATADFTAGRPGETPDRNFDRLLAEYVAVDDPDRSQRVAKRDHLANRLGELGRRMQIARSTLDTGPDAKIAVLATIILADPKKGDLSHLATAAKHVEYKFSGYRLVLALLTFLSNFSASPKTFRKAVEILDEIETRVDAAADDDLTAIIDRARGVIKASAG